jgi:hypothetical protein
MEQAAATTVMVPERCVIVVDAGLPVGRAANAAAVAQVTTSDMRYVGVALIGRRDPIKKIVGNLALLK